MPTTRRATNQEQPTRQTLCSTKHVWLPLTPLGPEVPRPFPYKEFLRCGHYGCGLVGELKKQKYVYYHCTGHRGKCEEPCTREEVVEDKFAAALKELVIPPRILKLLQESVSEADLNERAARDRELKRLEEQHRRLSSKLHQP